jgi:hypothetical protein
LFGIYDTAEFGAVNVVLLGRSDLAHASGVSTEVSP